MTRDFVETGDGWCTVVPRGWQHLPLRRLGHIVGGGTPTTDPGNWGGDIPFITPPDLRPVIGKVVRTTGRSVTEMGALTGSAVVPPGSVMLSIRAPIGYVARTQDEAAFNQGCRAIVPNGKVTSRFLAYALVAALPELEAQGRGTTFMELSATQMAGIRCPVPPVAEQRAITDYLDRELAKIDALIDEQNGLVKVLAERRYAVVAETAVGTFDPLVPECGPSVAIGYKFSVTLGKMLDGGKEGRAGDDLLPYIRAGNIQDCGLRLDDINSMPYSPAEAERLNLLAGDLLVAEGGAVGTCVVLKKGMPDWSFQKTVNRIRSLGDWSTDWLAYVIRTYRDRGVIDIVCNRSTIAHLTAEKLRALRVPDVPPQEQRKVAAYLDDQTAKIDALIAEAEGIVAVAKERRSALITAAVTGQIDVRGEVAA